MKSPKSDRREIGLLKRLKHLDHKTLVEMLITPAALAGFADRSHVKGGKVVKGYGYRFTTAWHTNAALLRAIQRKN